MTEPQAVPDERSHNLHRRKWLTKEQAAKHLKLSKRTVETLAQRGDLVKKVVPGGNGNRYKVPMFDANSVEALKIARARRSRSRTPHTPSASAETGGALSSPDEFSDIKAYIAAFDQVVNGLAPLPPGARLRLMRAAAVVLDVPVLLADTDTK